MNHRQLTPWTAVACLALAGCSALGIKEAPPQLAPAKGAALIDCSALASFSFPNTTVTAARLVATGTLNNGGQPVAEHCQVTGQMNRRTSPVDGQTYAIGFEMRLPRDWSGRFLYQGNGGTDGNVVTADGGASLGSGGMLRHGLQQGFAVISADAGHTAAQNPLFGRDPQARLDYGYQAVGSLTPMAKALVRAAYGKGPDRSYIGGTSNGGRHALVAASRWAAEYDGILANAPGIYQFVSCQTLGLHRHHACGQWPARLRIGAAHARAAADCQCHFGALRCAGRRCGRSGARHRRVPHGF